MKAIKFFFTLILSLVFSVAGFSQSSACIQSTTPKEPLSIQEQKSLLNMLDEEKLAHDVYITFSEIYTLPVFKNISKAETQHYSVVLEMVKKYEIEYVEISEVGKYINSEFENIYTELISRGKTSVVEALKVGAEIEDLDIFDLNEALKNDIDNNDISIVYKNIREGAFHHLKAFTNILKRYDEKYTPKYISLKEFNDILN